MGYVDYFLIVSDFIRYAKEKGIMVDPEGVPRPEVLWPTALELQILIR